MELLLPYDIIGEIIQYLPFYKISELICLLNKGFNNYMMKKQMNNDYAFSYCVDYGSRKYTYKDLVIRYNIIYDYLKFVHSQSYARYLIKYGYNKDKNKNFLSENININFNYFQKIMEPNYTKEGYKYTFTKPIFKFNENYIS
jgi:hypothetical protein